MTVEFIDGDLVARQTIILQKHETEFCRIEWLQVSAHRWSPSPETHRPFRVICVSVPHLDARFQARSATRTPQRRGVVHAQIRVAPTRRFCEIAPEAGATL